MALDHDLEVIPVINKIDLPSAQPERVINEIEDVIGLVLLEEIVVVKRLEDNVKRQLVRTGVLTPDHVSHVDKLICFHLFLLIKVTAFAVLDIMEGDREVLLRIIYLHQMVYIKLVNRTHVGI